MTFKNSSVVRIFAKGGILSPGDMQKLIRLAGMAFVDSLSFGFRQEIYLEVHNRYLDELVQGLTNAELVFDLNDSDYQNIVTSYCATDIFPTTNWVSHEAFLDVLEDFDFRPQLKVNFVDPLQGLVPVFSGEVNFITSTYSDFWYLYINLDGYAQPYCWPVLIHSDHAARLSKEIEKIVLSSKNTPSGESIYEELVSLRQWDTRPIDKEFIPTRVRFPYYEGLNKGNTSFWLGIYRRSYDFPLAFFNELCELCSETKIGKISTTSWKTLIVKDIKEEDRIKWEVLLGKYGINIRHSFSDLNWQIEDLDKTNLRLKLYLAREFDKKDIRTYGLIFSIGKQPFRLGASVYIEKKVLFSLGNWFKVHYRYNVYYRENFDVNSNKILLYHTDVASIMLPSIIEELCTKYYANLTKLSSGVHRHEQSLEITREDKELYQCKHCKSIYDKEYGEPQLGIPTGVDFALVTNDFCCPLCDAPKSDYVRVDDYSTQVA